MRTRACFAMLAALAAGTAAAQETRVFRPIARAQQLLALPDGAVRFTPPLPVPRAVVESAVAVVLQNWNGRSLDQVLSPTYSQRQELLDALQTRVPRDASLRLVSLQGYQVLDQYRLGDRLFWQVSVTVQTQLEFNDPSGGFQARGGTNAFVITVGSEVGR